MVAAGEAADAGLTLPWWLAIVFAVIAAVAPVLTGWLTYRAAVKATQASRDAAAATNATAQRANALAASKSDRELMMSALAMAQSENPETKRHGYALLSGLATMSGLSPDDAILVQGLTRPLIVRTLSTGRRIEEI